MKNFVNYRKILSLLVYLIIISLLSISNEIFAAKNKKNKKKISQYNPLQASLVINADNGKILHSKNCNRKIYPASLTKIMTLYILFESITYGKIDLDSKMYVSNYASSACPSKLFLKQGEKIAVRDAILGVAVKSANDAARVVAENIAGSEEKFALLMTIRAKQLGMNDTVFKNASGLHHPSQVTTAVDLAKLSMAIKRDFPQFYHFFSYNSFYFKDKLIRGHNKVTENYLGATGLKTGYTRASGFNLITSATRKSKNLIAVVIGGKTSKSRNDRMVSLLDNHF